MKLFFKNALAVLLLQPGAFVVPHPRTLRLMAVAASILAALVVAAVAGTQSGAAPLFVMTPRSGWWSCASEGGGGIACWLEIMRAIHDAKPVRDVLFVASSGHELGHIGLDAYIARRPGSVPAAKAWIHLGAHIGAAMGPGNHLQSSDDEMESLMDEELETHHQENARVVNAFQALADGTPALGIVAAVLGVIKTMGSITEPPAVLGGMIGGALVGTFLGVFLAYGLVGPMANRLKEVVDEEGSFYKIIQSVLVAHLHGNAAQISVEIGRGNVPSPAQPSFVELEEKLGQIPAEA